MPARDVLVVVLVYTAWVAADLQLTDCEVTAKTESGYVCGRRRPAADGKDYASFRGIPYAKQPLGKLRFQELLPPELFDRVFDAREAGPVCPQVDVYYGPLLQPRSMGEDCIRINIHVPIHALPDHDGYGKKPLLPIFTWIHGGGFSYGSGDADFHGPEYLVTKGIILVTFNYRLNVLGFLSLNSVIPGNNGLRDSRTALQWLQRNAKFFGGNPDNVTIGGQSAGGAMAHMLSISPACVGLFHKVISLSGNALSNFFSYSPKYSRLMANLFLMYMGINIFEDSNSIHQRLLNAPIERIIEANRFLLDQFGLVSFAPVIETPEYNFTPMLPRDPELLLNEGNGNKLPILFGFTSNETKILKGRFKAVHSSIKLRLFPCLIVPINLLFMSTPLLIPTLTSNMLNEYSDNSLVTMDTFLNAVTDTGYKYPVLRAVRIRNRTGSAPTYYYEFSYHGDKSILKELYKNDFRGAGHSEDITYFFRLNSVQEPVNVTELEQDTPDSMMRETMTSYITNFVKTGDPTPQEQRYGPQKWPEADHHLRFARIHSPKKYSVETLSPYLKKMKRFFDKLYKHTRF